MIAFGVSKVVTLFSCALTTNREQKDPSWNDFNTLPMISVLIDLAFTVLFAAIRMEWLVAYVRILTRWQIRSITSMEYCAMR